MKEIPIQIKDKIAVVRTALPIVCGNSDYIAVFTFIGDDWSKYPTKTARFVYGNEHIDVVFTSDRCDIPPIPDAPCVEIGVYAGDIKTSTPAYVRCLRSITSGTGSPADPPESVYNQLMEQLKDLGELSDEELAAAIEAYFAEHPVTETPDWSQNDETASDYIKNRTHYEKEKIVAELDYFTDDNQTAFYMTPAENGYAYNTTYTVVINGKRFERRTLQRDYDTRGAYVVYLCPDRYTWNDAFTTATFMVSMGAPSSYPDVTAKGFVFSCRVNDESLLPVESVYIIDESASEIKQLDEKFIPDSIARAQTEAFVVTVKGDSDEYTADKSFDEILSAVKSGRSVWGYYESYDAQLDIYSFNDEQIVFVSKAEITPFLGYCDIEISFVSDGTIAVEEQEWPSMSGTPDWNENDEYAAGYIKNRTHYVENVDEQLVSKRSFAPRSVDMGSWWMYYGDSADMLSRPLEEWEEVVVTYDGEEYVCTVRFYEQANNYSSTKIGIGNRYLFSGRDENDENTGEPFFFDGVVGDTSLQPFAASSGTHTFSIARKVEYFPLDERFISSQMRSDIKSAANKMDSVNPSGTGSFSLNRREGSDVGVYSHAEGQNCVASGQGSHAEGNGSQATGAFAHAEGGASKASGIDAHAEGSGTTASDYCSHSEGLGTVASGRCSHAAGEYTIAAGEDQYVIGHYNEEDTEDKYAFIIGGGENRYGTTTRKNVFTVDWKGQAWSYYGGNLLTTGDVLNTLESNSTSFALSAAQGKVLKEMIDELDTGGSSGGTDKSLGITGATVGQIAKITAVDDSGVPTAWEAVELPSGDVENWQTVSYEIPEGTTSIKLNLPSANIRKARLTLSLYTSEGKPSIRLYGDVEASGGYGDRIYGTFSNFYTTAQSIRTASVCMERWGDLCVGTYTDAASSTALSLAAATATDFLYLVCATADVTITGTAKLYYTE